MRPIPPDVSGVDYIRVVLGKGQPEYQELPAVVVLGDKGRSEVSGKRPMVARFELSPEERALIAAGADLYIVQLTFGQKFHPVSVTVVPQGSTLDCAGL